MGKKKEALATFARRTKLTAISLAISLTKAVGIASIVVMLMICDGVKLTSLDYMAYGLVALVIVTFRRFRLLVNDATGKEVGSKKWWNLAHGTLIITALAAAVWLLGDNLAAWAIGAAVLWSAVRLRQVWKDSKAAPYGEFFNLETAKAAKPEFTKGDQQSPDVHVVIPESEPVTDLVGLIGKLRSGRPHDERGDNTAAFVVNWDKGGYVAETEFTELPPSNESGDSYVADATVQVSDDDTQPWSFDEEMSSEPLQGDDTVENYESVPGVEIAEEPRLDDESERGYVEDPEFATLFQSDEPEYSYVTDATVPEGDEPEDDDVVEGYVVEDEPDWQTVPNSDERLKGLLQEVLAGAESI